MRRTIYGQKSTVRKYEHELLIAPLAFFRRTIQALYETILHMLFTASVGKQTFDDGAFGFLFLLSFIVLCVLSYYLKEREVLIFIFSILLLVIDKYSSRLHYLKLDPRRQTFLKIRDETTVFEEVFKQKLLRRETFSNRFLTHLSIDCFEAFGGAFQERLAKVWRVSLHIIDQESPIAFHYGEEVSEVFKKATEISESYSLPVQILFSNSLGFGHYIASPLNESEKYFFIKRCRHTVKFQNQSSSKWIILSQWDLGSYSRMALEISKALLYAISLVLIINLMSELGRLFIKIIDGSSMPEISQALLSFKGAFLPANNLTEVLEIAVISISILFRQLNISLIEEIAISKNFLEYSLNGTLLGKMRTQSIKSIFLVEQPEPMILITDQTQFIQIPGLQTPEEFKAFLYRLSESVEHFR